MPDHKTRRHHKRVIEIKLLSLCTMQTWQSLCKLQTSQSSVEHCYIVNYHSLSKNIDEQTLIGLTLLESLVTLITDGLHKTLSNRITWLTSPTPCKKKTISKLALFWSTHENIANCKISTLKIWHDVKLSTRNLTRFNQLNWNLTRCQIFKS